VDASQHFPDVPGKTSGSEQSDDFQLTKRLFSRLEDERRRIARELHDNVSQRIALLAVQLDAMRNELSEDQRVRRDQLECLIKLAEEIGSEVQRMSHELHSSKLEYLGLVAALKGHCREFAEKRGVVLKFNHEGVDGSLPPDVTLCLFRVAQESLYNFIRHSGSKTAMVSLEITHSQVRLLVADEGCGFDVDSKIAGAGLGLVSMSERLRLVGGTLSIKSQLASGTRVEAVVPLGVRKQAVSQ
jgi:signal transduction histidine kinase